MMGKRNLLINDGKINLHDLIFFIMIIFPITTILQGLPIMGNLNRFIIVFLFVGVFVVLLKDGKSSAYNLILIFITFLLSFISIFLLNGNPIYSLNDALYFPSWIFIMLYSTKYYDEIKKRIVINEKFINAMLLFWNFIVFISLFFSSSYTHHWGDGTYFQSFSNAEHRFAASCLFALVVGFINYLKKRKFSRLLLIILPLIGIYLSGARTYLALLLLLVFGFMYKISKNKVKLIVYFSIIVCLCFMLLKVTPMGEKFMLTLQEESFRDPLATFTNGRSIFWKLQLSSFFDLNIFNLIFGAGYNFVYDVSNLWAHNDVINILLNFGFVGVFMYLYTYFKFIIHSFKKDNCNSFIIFCVIVMIWFLNAMLNMVYTYMCATLCLPFISILLGGNYESNKSKNKTIES